MTYIRFYFRLKKILDKIGCFCEQSVVWVCGFAPRGSPVLQHSTRAHSRQGAGVQERVGAHG